MTSESGPLDNTTSQVTWFDSHCHLHDCDDSVQIIERAVSFGVRYATFVGTGLETSKAAVQLARECAAKGRAVWSTIGLHPHDASDGLDDVEDFIAESWSQADDGKHVPGTVVAIGECGLDYFYEHSPKEIQRDVFARQIELAHRYHATLVVHTRDAWDDTLSILANGGVPERTIIHCFSGSELEARKCLDLGAYLSFSGIVTFKSADDVRKAAQLCPIDRILVETDSPFLAPVPHRGKENEPAFVSIVGEAIAQLREVTNTEFADATTHNTATAFSVAL